MLGQLGNYFKPEFLNRFDDIVEFKALDKQDLMQIVGLMIADTNANIHDQGLTIHVTDPVKEKLVTLGFDPAMGARPLRRVIQEQIEDRVADYYLDHPAATNLEARIANGEIAISEKAE